MTAVLLGGAVATAGCSSNPAPDGWLPSAREVPADPYGAWIRVDLRSGDGDQVLEGEFVSAERDTLFLLTEGHLVGFPAASAKQVRVAWFDAEYGGLAAWSVFGTLGTLSHGMIAGLTMPIWILTGSLATGAQSRTPLVDYEPGRDDFGALGKYARFPQGLPHGIDRDAIRGKPGHPKE